MRRVRCRARTPGQLGKRTATDRSPEIDTLLATIADLERAGRPGEALEEALQSLDSNPGDLRAKRSVARLLRRAPQCLQADRGGDLERLLTDPEVDPSSLAAAGWLVLLEQGALARGGDAAAAARTLEASGLALLLLSEACVTVLEAELALSEVRRWLLLSRRWAEFPRLGEALAAQATLNGGAWPFDADERGALEQSADAIITAAYLPTRPPIPPSGRFDNQITQALSEDYLFWPYPVWSRITPPEPTTLPQAVEKVDPGRSSELPVQAEILVAGCGTGREAAIMARRFPDARITAIDISAGSLAYAAARCEGLGIDFRLMDLFDVGQLDRRFDLIASSGVLHHLPDPEARWARLVDVLNPRGVMKIMLYSRIARLGLQAARMRVADLLDRPVDDDLLRTVRQRLIEQAPGLVGGSIDFYNLSGVRYLLLNRHEVLFDVPRIARALDQLQLELLAFKLPTPADEARYRRDHPEDPCFRDVRAWGALELSQPFLFSGMYEFWCARRP
jgi:SAM-dependent methyltransferase